MLITIITVVFNAVSTIECTIKSVLDQQNANFEYIIIDGLSTDGTVDVIKKYEEKLAYYVSESDKGIYDAMNKAVLHAKGNWVYFLGADDVLYNSSVLNSVELLLKSLKKIYYGNVLFKKRNKLYDGKFNAIKLVTRNISHQSIFYPFNVFEKYTFNTRYKVFADYELNFKLYNHTEYSFEYMPITIAIFNDEGTSGLNSPDVNFETDKMAIIKNNFNYAVYLYRYLRTKIASIISNR